MPWQCTKSKMLWDQTPVPWHNAKFNNGANTNAAQVDCSFCLIVFVLTTDKILVLSTLFGF